MTVGAAGIRYQTVVQTFVSVDIFGLTYYCADIYSCFSYSECYRGGLRSGIVARFGYECLDVVRSGFGGYGLCILAVRFSGVLVYYRIRTELRCRSGRLFSDISVRPAFYYRL